MGGIAHPPTTGGCGSTLASSFFLAPVTTSSRLFHGQLRPPKPNLFPMFPRFPREAFFFISPHQGFGGSSGMYAIRYMYFSHSAVPSVFPPTTLPGLRSVTLSRHFPDSGGGCPEVPGRCWVSEGAPQPSLSPRVQYMECARGAGGRLPPPPASGPPFTSAKGSKHTRGGGKKVFFLLNFRALQLFALSCVQMQFLFGKILPKKSPKLYFVEFGRAEAAN